MLLRSEDAAEVLDALLDLVLPRRCSGCSASGGPRLCHDCLALLDRLPAPTVPDPCPQGLPTVLAVGAYDGALRQLLVAHKERAALHLTRPLASSLTRAAALLDTGPFVLCPVPSAKAAVRERGHDHALRLARAAASGLRSAGVASVARPLLGATRRTADQAGLTHAQRAHNLQGALVAQPVPPVRVIVVDDVMTTGATLAEATRALEAAGHEVLGGVVVAATRRRAGRSSRMPFTEGSNRSSV